MAFILSDSTSSSGKMGNKSLQPVLQHFLQKLKSNIVRVTRHPHNRGVARGVLGWPWPPLGRPSFEQTTYNIQVAKMPWQYLGRKSHYWKAHFFKICFFVKYFRQLLLSLVNMGLHAAIIRLSPLIHKGEQRYKPYIVGDPRMVSLSVIPPLKKILAMPLRNDIKHSNRKASWWCAPNSYTCIIGGQVILFLNT